MRKTKSIVDKRKTICQRMHRCNKRKLNKSNHRNCSRHFMKAIKILGDLSVEDEDFEVILSANQQSVQLNPTEVNQSEESQREEDTYYQEIQEIEDDSYDENKTMDSTVHLMESGEPSYPNGPSDNTLMVPEKTEPSTSTKTEKDSNMTLIENCRKFKIILERLENRTNQINNEFKTEKNS